MANSLSADLVTDIISEKVTTILGPKTLPFGDFATDFSNEAIQMPGNGKGSTVQASLATVAEAVQVNATNFEGGTTTIAALPMAVNQYTQRFSLTNAERRSGHRIENQVGINLQSLLKKLIDVMITPMTVTNYGAAEVDKTAAAFDAADVKLLRAAIAEANRKILLLHPDWYSTLLPTNLEHWRIEGGGSGYAGFDAIHEITRWDGAGDEIIGFAGDPQALGMVARIPDLPDGSDRVIDTATITLEPIGITVQVNKWIAAGSRTEYWTYDVVFGSALLDASAGVLIRDGSDE